MKSQANDKPYVEIFDRDGRSVHAMYPGCERYPREVELNMLEAGYTIKVNGRKVTRKELREETENSPPKRGE